MALFGAAPAGLRLADDYDDITIRRVPAVSGDPVVCTEWEVGSPAIREAQHDQAGVDGVLDSSSYTGARSVTFDLKIFGDDGESAYAVAERLAAFAHPSRRPWLHVTRGTEYAGESWRMALRGTPFSLAYGRRAAALLELQLAFTAPIGYFESELRGLTSAAVTAPTGGLVMPFTFPFTFGAGSPSGGTLTVGGSAPVSPVVYIYGPSVDPRVDLDTGVTFRFSGLTLDAGQFVAVDMGAGTVRLNADPTASVYHLVDWTTSTFWRLMPNQAINARLIADGGQLYIQWRDRRLTV